MEIKGDLFIKFVGIGLFSFLLSISFHGLVNASNERPAKPFDVKVIVETQSPWTKKIPITIQFTPKLDSKRTEITWTVPSIIEVEPEYKNYFYAQKGHTYTVKAILKPKGVGVVNGSVNVIDWDYGYNYGTSQKFSFILNEKFEITPYTEGYKSARQMQILILIVVSVLVLALAGLGVYWLIQKIIEFLKPPADLKG